MHGSGYHRTESRFLKLAALSSDAIVVANKSLRSTGAQTDYDLGTNDRDFSLQPWTTGCYFLGVGLFVDSPFTALGRIEMFDDVGDVDLVARDSSGEQRFVEQFASGPDKWMTRQVLLIARLFAN
jgi:hypothetical protein